MDMKDDECDNLGPEDAFDVLGVSTTQSIDEIRAVYHSLLLANHPDKNPNADVSRFQRITKAWNQLSNSETRSKLLAKRISTRKIENSEINVEQFRIDEFENCGNVYRRPCRCGGCYEFDCQDLQEGVNTAQCDMCSLYVSLRE